MNNQLEHFRLNSIINKSPTYIWKYTNTPWTLARPKADKTNLKYKCLCTYMLKVYGHSETTMLY